MSALGEVKGSCEVDSPVSFPWPQVELGLRSTFSVPGSPLSGVCIHNCKQPMRWMEKAIGLRVHISR